ncbi:exosome nuclease subunit [Coemansia helicoidea]|uniref:Exosome nuclease subunit n=1 Tax=Coemansia helicoidea TaxID=1286919 RepID=A0ACC1L1W0_9FUNG|nr:exosome nuclease subunit [Coemansia helicoidea]
MGEHLQRLGIPQSPASPASGAATPRRSTPPASLALAAATALGDAGPLRALPHPYEYEITHIEHPEQLFADAEPQPPADWDAVPFAFVDSDAGLAAMMAHLEESAGEIAIDLEHHDYRSYQGFTCLVQISSRTRDYVVDALALRGELQCLNRVTADPRRVKVFHGADHDIQWLQQDFGVYVVGLFDTYHASKVLNMAHHSLAHLLQTYCGYHADKKYQLADWRIRPVPDEMMRYARADTHFLLYVFDRMRGELLERGRRLVGMDVASPDSMHFGELAGLDTVQTAVQPMELVLQRSGQTALKTYAKEGYDADNGQGAGGWVRLLRKWAHPLTPPQLAVFRALHQWRDSCAREEDESIRYVLPNHMLFAIADRMPADEARLLAACRPTPPLVRLHAADMVRLIAHARSTTHAHVEDAHAAPATPRRPVHTRFDDAGSPIAADASRPDVLTPELLASAAAMVAPAAGLFGPPSAPVPGGCAESAARAAARARDIRSGLVLTVAVPQTVVTGAAAAAAEAEFTLVGASRKERPTPQRPAAPVVLSETFASARPGTAAATAEEGEKPADFDLSKLELGKPAGGQGQRKKRRAAQQKTADAVESFEYNEDSEDVIGESATPAKPTHRGKRAKKSAPFDPYAKIDSSAAGGKVARSRVSSKAGNRSMTYTK